MEDALSSIPARSRREAMDWGLVLLSQGIEAIIDKSDNGWALLVEPRDYDQAQSVLKKYKIENKGWLWRHPLPETGMLFHWGSLGWVAAMASFYYWSTVRFPFAKEAGILNSERIRQGQWWRLWTAITLHENMAHLMANATIGFILIGLAMARYGAGVGLLAAYLAAVAGNVASFVGYEEPHQSLGASGMVMGALGLVTAQSFSLWRRNHLGRRFFYRALAAGVLILAFTGFSPGSDVIAHVGGFAAGVLIGCGLGFAPAKRLQERPVSVGTLLLLAALVLATWRLALRAP